MALKCPKVQFTVVDIDSKRIAAWNSDHLPVYEAGLDDIVRARRGINLIFSTEIDNAIYDADIILIAINTPSMEKDNRLGAAADLRGIEQCMRRIAKVARHYKIIVEKSTVPCRTGDLISNILRQNSNPGVNFDVLSNPEFLSEGSAIRDLLYPDRVIIGGLDGTEGAQDVLKSIYSRWVPDDRIITMGLWSSELAKLASNALLAQRVSSINSISAVCEAVGADINEVSRGCGLDARIGSQFLQASVGFGGACFHKDIQSLIWLSESLGLHDVAEYWDQVLKMNESQMSRFVQRVINEVEGGLKDIRIAVLGFAFKSGTGDARNTPASHICNQLLRQGASLFIYDPKVPDEQIRNNLTVELDNRKPQFHICHDAYNAIAGSQVIVILTAWDEFQAVDWSEAHSQMIQPAYIFDGHRLLDASYLKQLGFHYASVGTHSKGRI
ncbi:UDP-glucose 6-dehydrogenase [Coemansia reversa NRRL 1564]|uniref:UDP-glucose 6-dehydrogenase n=1 Tax=Coemansia reversa (strain ATCC 12441 / NRRL 1564) TaxID=763665 RepID=A0A2G5BH23_COERN|nr:UDP-glucose 6-dehydrogenase [Coemansia reversa NRRL 1564]|eukprot:PIA18318.1 UDP-glucose 6-dehydrogenase [Coemansia reversa NRRL 1564]